MAQRYDEMEFPVGQYLRQYRGQIIGVAVAILVVVVVGSMFYSVETDSEGVVLRFGKYVRTAEPGLHFKFPHPIETVHVVPVQRIQASEFGYATIAAGRVTKYARPSEQTQAVALMLTGDLNLAHVEWIVQYRAKDAFKYLFKIGGSRDPRIAVGDTIQDVSESVMRKLVGDASVDEVITIGRDEIAAAAKVEIQQMLDQFEAGVQVVTVKLQAATPPDPVKGAFDEVNRARQNKEQVINEARGERNREIPAARGKKAQAISEARGYAQRVVMEAKGRVNAFLAQLKEYEKAPQVTRTRLYLEAMQAVLSQVDNKIIIDQSIRGLLPMLNLDSAEIPASRKGGAR